MGCLRGTSAQWKGHFPRISFRGGLSDYFYHWGSTSDPFRLLFPWKAFPTAFMIEKCLSGPFRRGIPPNEKGLSDCFYHWLRLSFEVQFSCSARVLKSDWLSYVNCHSSIFLTFLSDVQVFLSSQWSLVVRWSL